MISVRIPSTLACIGVLFSEDFKACGSNSGSLSNSDSDATEDVAMTDAKKTKLRQRKAKETRL